MIKKLIIIGITVGLMSCASTSIDLSKELGSSDYLKDIENSKYSGALFSGDEDKENKKKKEQFEFYPGTGDFIDKKAASKQPSVAAGKGEYTFNFEGTELPIVVKMILGDILAENYVIAPGISGSVSFATIKPINKDQILPILEMLLSWNNAALVYTEGRYHVVPQGNAIKGILGPRYGQISRRKGYTVMVVPLKYIAPAEMEKVLTPYAKEGAIVKADNARNLLFLAGTKRELANYMDTIDIFDVDWLEGMSTGIFTLNRVEADTIVGELEAIFGEGADNPLAGMFRFMPIERLNAIMVITPQEKYLYKAQEWIKRLDRSDSEASSNLYVYNVKNIKADDLAGYLSDVFGGSSNSSGSSKKNNSGKVAPGLSGKEIGSTGNKSKKINKTKSRSSGSKKGDGGVKFTAIEENNQLLISANAQEYDSILAAISQLDIEPKQVLIEAKIIEVTLDENQSSGVEWLFGSEITTTPVPTPNKILGIRGAESARFGAGGLAYVLTGLDVQARINADDTKSRLTVLSTPSLLVLNNKEASINVGARISVPSNSINNGGFNTFSSVRFLQTGTKLTVTPRINPGGLVYVEVSQEVSSPTGFDVNGNRDISNRELTTEIAVQSGDTIVMGGLIKEDKANGKSGAPILNRIPLVGSLFGSRNRSNKRTELILLLTPTVIENPEQAKQLTKEYANQFKGLKPLKNKFDKYLKNTEKKEENENDE